MTLTQLNYLSCVHRCGSLRRAAKELQVSQPSVTEAIHALEADLNQKLLQFSGNRTTLTEAGLRVLDTAEIFFREENRLREDLSALSQRSGSLIRLAFGLYVPLPMQILQEYQTANPQVKISIDQCSALHVIQLLEQEECEFGILYTEMLTGRFGALDYGSLEFGIFCPNGHALLQYEKVPRKLALSYLEQQMGRQTKPSSMPAIDGSDPTDTRSSLSLASRNLSGAFHPSLDPMLEALQAQLNNQIAILPLNYTDDSIRLQRRPIDPPLLIPLSLAWNPKHFLSREAIALRSHFVHNLFSEC
ncbi:MAG: LysR family transcriptional regulator [Lachnospiraceae bacterium]|nr:LysR family transcriptional regulator [Lachnospiraceae bacterium]